MAEQGKIKYMVGEHLETYKSAYGREEYTFTS